MGSSKSLHPTRNSFSSQSQINLREIKATGRYTPDPTSSSHSLSSARKRHFQEVDQGGRQRVPSRTEEHVIENDQSDSEPNPKRSRPSPRTSDVSLSEFGSVSNSRRRQKQASSSASSRARLQSRRSSKFTEGSMRDRASDCPPEDFTHDESASSRSMSMQHQRASEEIFASCDAGIEVSRPSAIQRLSKTLATAFNTASTYQGPRGGVKGKDEARVSQEQQRLDNHRMRAEAAYAELQRNHFPGTRRISTHSSHASISRLNFGGESTEYQALLKRNSYADRIADSVGQGSNRNRPIAHALKSEQELAQGSTCGRSNVQVFECEREDTSPTPDLHVAPPIEINTHQERALSPLDSPITSAIENAKQPARVLSPPTLENPLSSLKKVKSFFRIPNARNRSLSPSRATPVASDQSANPPNGVHLRESPSKKELKKQKKLMNKISNLEDKLEHAKRSLWLTSEEAPPVPDIPTVYSGKTGDLALGTKQAPAHNPAPTGRATKFVPGLLPTLPSERLLNPSDCAIHEELLRRKVSLVEEESSKNHPRRFVAKAPLESSFSGSNPVYQLCPNLSPGSPSHDSKTKGSGVEATLVYAQNMEQKLKPRNVHCSRPDIRADATSSLEYLADKEIGRSLTSNECKGKGMKQDRAHSEDFDNKSIASQPSTSLQPAGHQQHHRSASRGLRETTAESVNQMGNQGLQMRRDDWGSRVMTSSPKKRGGVPPLPSVPKAMQGVENSRPGGKENQVKDARLSGVREEEEFTWDEDVF